MASKHAREAYPYSGNMGDYQQDVFAEAFDRGAVTALREAAERFRVRHGDMKATELHRMADEWEASGE